MSEFQQRLKSALERAIVSADAASPNEVESVLQTFRVLAARQINAAGTRNPELAKRATRILDDTIAEFRMTATTDSEAASTNRIPSDADAETASSGEVIYDADPDDDAQAQPMLRPFLAGVLATLGAVALLLFLANRAGYLSTFSVFQKEDEAGFVIPPQDTVFVRSIIPSVLETAEKAQVVLTSNSETISVADGKRFRPFREVFPDLWKEVPTLVKRSVNIRVRKNGAAYKILFSSGICPLITATGDIEKDPRRERNESLTTLCTYFSVWNNGGKDF